MSFIHDGYLTIVIVCFIISIVLVPLTIRIARHIGAVSIPHARHIHTKPTALLGGLAIFLTFIVGIVLFVDPYTLQYKSMAKDLPTILMCTSLILLLGIIDDIKPLRARVKFISQVLIAIIVVYFGEISIDSIFKFLPTVLDNSIANILTVFWIVSVINAINLVDGLNGLSSGVASIYFSTVLIVAFGLNTPSDGLALYMSAIILGATLGFLPWNFPRAKAFMGDTGSMFLGLMIAIIPLLGFKQVTVITLFVPMMMMIVPILEIFSTIFRRMKKSQSIGEADTEHIHHQLLRATNSPLKAVIIIWIVSIAFSIIAIMLEYKEDWLLPKIMFGILVLVSFIFIQLSHEFNNENSTLRKLYKRLKK